jgi:1-acyl-sn-glycerol-3-phosphate acyltransferase
VTVLRAVWRTLGVLALVVRGWFIIVFLFPRWPAERRQARVQLWSRQMMEALGIRLQVAGDPPAHGPLLLVANHLSWLDILVIHAARHCRFVAKSEVRHWPLIGTLAAGAGTLFIERDKRRDALRVVHHMAESLQAQAAVSAHAPVQPVALRYVDLATGADSTRPLYLGDDTLVASIWRTLAGPPFEARVRFGQAQAAEGRDRRKWAADLQQAVAQLRDRAAF